MRVERNPHLETNKLFIHPDLQRFYQHANAWRLAGELQKENKHQLPRIVSAPGLTPMRSRLSEMGRHRFGWVSGAQSGSAVRSAGGLLETSATAPVKYRMFESAMV
jgi:hypothetical protein